MNDIILFMLSYAIIIFGTLGLLNFLSKGFLLTYLRVKASRFSKVMARIKTAVDVYYKVASVEDDVLIYPKRGKKEKGYSDLPADGVRLEMGINIADVEEATGNILTKSFETYPGHNTEKFDGILTRALQKPALDRKKDTITLILQIATLAAVLYCLFMVFNLQNALNSIPAAAAPGVI
jgi:hypothetical protein